MKTYNLKETADLLHCSYSHVKRNWRQWGGVKVGKKAIFSEDAIRGLLRGCSTSEAESIGPSSSTEVVSLDSPLARRISEMRRDTRLNSGGGYQR